MAAAAGSGLDLSGPGSIAGALAVLAGIITVHECGHFVAARSQGIHVTKFAIGFGPPLLSYQVGILSDLPLPPATSSPNTKFDVAMEGMLRMVEGLLP